MTKQLKRPFEALQNQPAKVQSSEEFHNSETPETSAAQLLIDPAVEIPREFTLSHRNDRFHDRYKLSSYYVHRGLLKLLDERASVLGKGAKTMIINEALRRYLVNEPKQAIITPQNDENEAK